MPADPAAQQAPPAGDQPSGPPTGAPPGGFGPGGFRGRRGEGGFGGAPGGGGGAGGGIASTLSETIRMDGDQIVLQFPNNPVADMLSIYELLTNITLIKDTTIFEGPQVSLATPKPVSKEEAVKLIEATLFTNGYAIVMEPDGRSARILPARTQSANSVQFSQGVNFYTSPLDLPEGETLVSYFMRLNHLDPEEAARMLSGHVGLGIYGRITPVTTPPGLLITENSSIVWQLINIKEAIDIADTGSALLTKFIPVEYADAATVAQIIQATLDAQLQEEETRGTNTFRGSPVQDNRSNQGGGDQRSSSPQPSSQNFPGSSNRSSSQDNSRSTAPKPKAQVVADTRLNQILVVSSPDDYTYIASMIAEFDKVLPVDEPYERKLKYASAVDVLSAIADLLQDTGGGATQLPGGGTLQQQRNQVLTSTSSQLLTGRTTTGTRGGQLLATGGADDTATGGTGTVSRADLIQGPTEDNAPISVLIGKTRVVADPMSNSILVMGRKDAVDKVNGLLDKLDRKPAQVYLSTVIGQLTLGDGFEFGVDYLSALTSKEGTNFSGSSFVSRQDVLSGNAVTRAVRDLRDNVITTPFGPAAGMNLYGAIGDSLEVFVTALEATNRFRVLSRPSVFALNNKKATITSGQLIPVPAQTISVPGNNNNVNGSVTTTVEYRDVVLKLEVVPLINSDGEVQLTIAQVNDTVIGTQRVEPNDIPIIGTEQIITSVTVPDRNTIVLGGLISEQEKRDTQGMPFLSRIPGVGNLFKDNKDSTNRSELIIFIQPQVINDNNALRFASMREDVRTKVGADAAEKFPQQPVIPTPTTAPGDTPQKKGIFSRIFSSKRASTPLPGRQRQ
ncbi:MAG TPA: hypothetical protein DIT13_12060 [Verrucomicrobiales bacterium]|nr:hypothetical protein [Verrucomicrobiales bacterium]HRJ07034.1 secretin N-terminal domain-containing protein [Prosthecobacter sp.]HRK12947.1 secretin N-terminal domain-containing protein [Prosthecobacter sp.]